MSACVTDGQTTDYATAISVAIVTATRHRYCVRNTTVQSDVTELN